MADDARIERDVPSARKDLASAEQSGFHGRFGVFDATPRDPPYPTRITPPTFERRLAEERDEHERRSERRDDGKKPHDGRGFEGGSGLLGGNAEVIGRRLR